MQYDTHLTSTELSDLQRICKDLTMDKLELNEHVALLKEQLGRKAGLLRDTPPVSVPPSYTHTHEARMHAHKRMVDSKLS